MRDILSPKAHPTGVAGRGPAAGPFALDDDSAYRRWREWKLAAYPTEAAALVVEVGDAAALTPTERDAMLAVCAKTNLVIYRSRAPVDKDGARRLGERFGLRRLDSNLLADEDSISSLQVVPGKSGRGYIPYSNRRLLWHTDGYYNSADCRIRAFLLHCASPAARGGDNGLMDHELVYLRLRDENPEHVRALMAPDAMTIPANAEDESAARGAVSGPVFSVDAGDGSLHMRYTARTRSIAWKDDAPTRAAVAALERLLADDGAGVFHHRLAAGEGLLCNNVLHNRSAFEDDAGSGVTRLLYRARYHDRIDGTQLVRLWGRE
jgi:alpha-ketoglutarate-dependent taurine dioxygenase